MSQNRIRSGRYASWLWIKVLQHLLCEGLRCSSFYFVRKSISTEKSPFHWTECEWDSIDSHWERNWSWNQFEQKILPNQNKCESIKPSESIMNREQNEWRVNFSTTHRYLALLTFVLNHSHAHANNFDTIKTQSYLFLKLVDQKKIYVK